MAMPVRDIAIDYYEDGVDHGQCQYLHKPLYDVLHNALKNDYQQDPSIHHILLYAIVVLYMLLYYCSNGAYTLRRQTYAIATWALLLMLKTATTILTIVPSPITECRATQNDHVGSPLLGTACNDMMFSGHTVVFVLTTCVVLDLEFDKPPWDGVVKLLWTASAVTCIVLVIATRQHYSNDCLISAVLTWLSYSKAMAIHDSNNPCRTRHTVPDLSLATPNKTWAFF